MTLDDAKEKAKMLGELNLDLWNATSSRSKQEIRDMFISCFNNLVNAGFKVIKRRVYDENFGYKIPVYTIREDHSESLVEITDNRGSNPHSRDCTTRCISFLTGIDYDSVYAEQMRLLSLKRVNRCNSWMTWRHEPVWSQCLTSRGFCRLTLPRKVAIKTFMKTFNRCGLNTGMIAACCSRHIVAIDMEKMKILDTWNSAGCRIKNIYIPVDRKHDWENQLILKLS